MIDQTILHYKIIDKLGEGGMGVVYKARDAKLDRTVALKFLPQHLTSSQEDKQRFIREAKAAAALNHPNICTIFNIDEHEDTPFIVMEYIEGETIRTKIDNGNLTVDTALAYAKKIADALSEAHQNNIIHRDIKPENIMVDAKGRIKVMDFGLAKLKQARDITKTGDTVGTLAYMSPEQIRGQQVDHRSDIFSLGIVLYEMLTGHKPFQGEHQAAMTYSIVNEEPAPLSRHLPDAPEELTEFFNRLLAKAPDERMESASQVAELLENLKESSDVQQSSAEISSEAKEESSGSSSTTISITLPVLGFGEKPIGWPGLLFGTVAILVLVLFIGWWFWEEPPEPEPDFSNIVAVTAFENQTGDSDLDNIGVMVADWITQGLQRIDNMRVVPPQASIRQEGFGPGTESDRASIQSLFDQTGARTVISGVYYMRNNQLELHTQLIDGQTGTLMEVLDPIEGDPADPMEAIDAIRQQVMSLVAAHFDEYLDNIITIDDVPKYEAYHEYVEGLKLYVGAYDFEAAIPHFRSAYQEDSTFLSPLFYEGVGQMNLGNDALADSLFNLVLEQNANNNREVRIAAEWGQAMVQGDLERRYELMKEFVDLVPGEFITIYQYGAEAYSTNRPHEAVEILRQIDPETEFEAEGPYGGSWYPYWRYFVNALHRIEQYNDELEQAENAQQFHSDRLDPVYWKARALVALGSHGKMEELLEQHRHQLNDGYGWSWGRLLREVGLEIRAHDSEGRAEQMLERALAWYEEQTDEKLAENRAYSIARTLYELEKWDEAEARFETLVEEETGNIDYRGYLGVVAVMRGNDKKAQEIDYWLKDLERPYLRGQQTRWRARIAAARNEEERAISLLEQSFTEGIRYGVWLHTDQVLTELKGNPNYESLVQVKD